jgi:diacylglycerol kinase family enzyme
VGLTREVALIVNPSAGGGRAARVLPRVEARLRTLGIGAQIDATRDLAHAAELAVAAARSGRVVVTLSGDGMLGKVAGALREVPDAVVGVLPGGRGNDFARVAGIPLDAEAACDVIASGVPRALDMGQAANTPYIGIASLGFDSEANRIANDAPEVDGTRVAFTGWGVAMANSKAYGGGMFVAPDAELDDGALDVIRLERTSKARFLRSVLPKVFKGEHVNEPSVHALRGTVVRVESARPFTVYADGDPVGELPMTFRALPGAVQVLLP